MTLNRIEERDGEPIPQDEGESFDPSKPMFNVRHERYVQALYLGNLLCDCVLSAGYEDQGRERNSQFGSSLRKRRDVNARLNWMQKQAERASLARDAVLRTQAAYTKVEALQEAEQARIMAVDKQAPNCIINAVRLKSEISGILETEVKLNKPIRQMTLMELEQFHAELKANRNATAEQPAADNGGSAAPSGDGGDRGRTSH